MWCQCLNVTSIRPSSVVKLREDQVVADEVPVTVPVRTLQWLTGPMPPGRHGRCGRRGRAAGSRAGGRGGRWSSRRTPSTWWRRRPQPMSCTPGQSTSWRAPTGSSPPANSGGWTPQTSAGQGCTDHISFVRNFFVLVLTRNHNFFNAWSAWSRISSLIGLVKTRKCKVHHDALYYFHQKLRFWLLHFLREIEFDLHEGWKKSWGIHQDIVQGVGL